MFKVGRFEVSVWDPYPVWITIRTESGEIRLSHSELRDLEYAVSRAMRDARQNLKQPSGDLSAEV